MACRWMLLLALGAACAAAFPADADADGPAPAPAAADPLGVDWGVETARRFMVSCGDKGLVACAKVRALTAVDRALRRSNIEVADGVAFVKSGGAEGSRLLAGRALTEAELDASLPGDADEKDAQVENLLVDRIARFLESFTVQFKMPDSAVSEVRKTLDEARGKKKKIKMLLPILLLAKLKAAALIPLALGGLALLSFKALIVGKLALLLAGIIALQKLLGSRQNSSSYEVVSHPHYSHSHVSSYGDEHGHYGRSLPVEAAPAPAAAAPAAAHDLAYAAYKQE